MISVCMATYNGARYIKDQIDSILPQLSENDELIISDDGSTDGTLDIIKSYEDKRIKILHHKKKENENRKFYLCTANFENAIKNAKGSYIFLSDQDDIWAKNKIEITIPFLKKYDYVLSNFSTINKDNKLLEKLHFKTNPIQSFYRNISHPNFWGCCTAFNHKMLKAILPFPNIPVHDTWIGLVAYCCFTYQYISEPLVFHRVHEQNTTLSSKDNTLLFKLTYRFNLLLHLLGRKLKI